MQCGRPPQQRTGRQVHRPLRLLDRRIGKGRAFVAYAAALRLVGRSESVRVAAPDAHVVRLVPLFELYAVRGEAVAQPADRVAITHPDAELHPGGWRDPLLSQTERERLYRRGGMGT